MATPSIYRLLLLLALCPVLAAKPVDVFFGATGDEPKGIHRAKFDPQSGALTDIQFAAEAGPAGFLAFSPDQNVLYAGGVEGKEGSVLAFRIDSDGALKRINHQPTGDGRIAHLSVHPSGKFLLTAQYGGGSVGVFPLRSDGGVGPRAQLIKHEGGARQVPKRMDRPHPHWTGYSPDGRFAFVPDLGMNEIVIYRVLDSPEFIEPAGSAKSIPGGGVRHMRFSTDGRFVFVLNELTVSVTTFAYDAETGQLERRSTTPALREAVKSKESFNSGSEILVHPSGRFVYSANRGNDSVTAYAADPETGRLTVIEVEPIRGSWPRNINMDASGRWLLAAGARSNTLSVFAIDQTSGELRFPQNAVYNVPGCVCILLRD